VFKCQSVGGDEFGSSPNWKGNGDLKFLSYLSDTWKKNISMAQIYLTKIVAF
jgi:hypothetical protein